MSRFAATSQPWSDVDCSGERDRVVCPCHGSEYDPWGGNLKGTAKEPLASYAVREEAGALVVTVE